jgi:hypothetical protein
MSSYGDPDPEHRNAVNQVTDARQKALNAVSEIRKADITTPHPNLAPPTVPIERDHSPSLPVLCSQAVVDYLLQLRPYRHHADNWEINFGEIQLPENVTREKGGRKRGSTSVTLQNENTIPLTNANEIIAAVNTTVVYQSVDMSGRSLGGNISTNEERYKVVFSPGTLLRIVEAADEIAAEMDMLAELSPPDHSAGGGDAV